MKATFLAIALLAFAGFPEAAPQWVTRGEIVSVSVADRTITIVEIADESSSVVSQSGVRRDMVVTEATKLTARGETIELDDIEVGAIGTFTFVMEEGKNIALVIDVRSSATE
jgi:septum formation inhibitor-activating ATPase MinD